MNSKALKYLCFSVLITAGLGYSAMGDQVDGLAGVIGIDPIEEPSAIAVFIPVESGQALSGVGWFNNDGSVVFPEILVAGGVIGYPEPVSTAVVVAQNVNGATSGWSQLEFTQPIASDSEGLYVIFRLPVGSEYQHDGLGGGSAFGYTDREHGYPGWFTKDAENWIMLHESYGIAVQPTYVPAEGWMMVKSMADGNIARVTDVATGLLPSTPNPFNPSTEIRFAIGIQSVVELVVYDLRGQVIKRLASGPYPAGTHSVTWAGTDENGRRVASGTYLAAFKAGGFIQTRRLVLVK